MSTTTPRRLESRIYRGVLKIVGIGFLSLPVAGVILSYQFQADYYAKVSVDLAARYAEEVTHAVGGHHSRYKAFPANLSDLSLPEGDSGYVPRLALDASTGALSVVIESNHGKFGSLRYLPTRDGSGGFRWRCVNVSVPMSLLPPQCKQINTSLSR